MSPEAPSRHAVRAERDRSGSTFRSFRRLLTYVWPHKRYLIPAVGCIFLMAITYSAGIGSILPVLKVMVEDEGLHGWVHRHIAEERLHCEFGVYDPQFHRRIEGLEPGTAVLRRIKSDSPLHGTDLESDDYIVAIDGRRGPAVDIADALVTAEHEARITYRSSTGDAEEQSLTIQLAPLEYEYQLLYRAVGLIPGGRSPGEKLRTLSVVLLLLFGLLLIGNIARVLAEYLAVLVNCRAILDLRRHMFRQVLRLPLSHFSENSADTMSRFLQDINDIFRGLNNFFQKVVAEPFKAIGVLILAFKLNWRLTLVMMLAAPVAAVLFRKLGKKIRRANRSLLISYGQMLGRLESTLTGMRVVKGYGRETYERRSLFHIDRNVLRQQLRMGFIEALTSPLVETLGFLGASAAILYFASQMFAQDVRLSSFMTMLICLGAIFDPLRKLSTVYPKLQRANAAAERIFALIDSPSEYDDDGKARLAPLRKTIEFRHVNFTYQGGTRPAVLDVSLTVQEKEIIAIVGPNGSGKTTLLSLLPRFFPLTSGQILIDGQDINTVTLRSLRAQFSLITQESVIFPDTVRANIAYGRPDATEEHIRDAARKAFADEFIQQMPEGYESMVGEHGAKLSGGQRQRIAIARAILRNAPILMFDEATSQVDPDSERKIHQALDAFLKDRTAFIIAHRFSTISEAHRIVVMDEGRVVDVGTHDELMVSSPLYRRLYETQFRNEMTSDEVRTTSE